MSLLAESECFARLVGFGGVRLFKSYVYIYIYLYSYIHLNTIYSFAVYDGCYDVLVILVLVAVVIFATDADSPPDFWANTSHEGPLSPPPSL